MEYIYILKYLCKCHPVNLKTKWHIHHVIRVNVKDFVEDLTLGSYDDYNRIISTHSQRYAVFVRYFHIVNLIYHFPKNMLGKYWFVIYFRMMLFKSRSCSWYLLFLLYVWLYIFEMLKYLCDMGKTPNNI